MGREWSKEGKGEGGKEGVGRDLRRGGVERAEVK